MDGGAWQATHTVHKVTKSQAQLSDVTSTSLSFFFFKNFYFYFILLYNTVLVLPYIALPLFTEGEKAFDRMLSDS